MVVRESERRSFHVENANAKTLRPILVSNVRAFLRRRKRKARESAGSNSTPPHSR